MTNRIAAFCVVLSFLIGSCTPELPEAEQDLAKEIVSFSLKKANGTAFDTADMIVTLKTDTIGIELAGGTDISQLIPEIVIKGKSIQPASGVAQNFESPVRYKVFAEDGSFHEYVVIITLGEMPVMLYFGASDNNFYALNARTGKLKWKYTGGGSFAYSSATSKDGIVYVGCVDSYVYAFDAITGEVQWKFKAGDTGIESDAVIVDNTVYVGSNDDHLYALNAADGSLKWKFLTGANVSASPTVLNGIVYFGSSDNSLYALNANTGDKVWQYSAEQMINQSGPCLVNGIIYFGSRDGHLHAVDALTGLAKWTFSTNEISLESSSPTVDNGVVYIGGWYNFTNFNIPGSVYAVNAITGQLVWEGLAGKGFSTSPCVRNGRLFIGCDEGYINALNTNDGSLIWRKLIYPNSSSPLESNGVVYIGGGGTWYYYAFNAATGEEIWRFPILNGIMASSPLLLSGPGDVTYSGDSGVKQ